MASAELAALGLPDDAGANQQLSPATEDERSTAMVDGIARWLAAAGAVGAVRSSRRRGFESFPGDRLGNNQGLRNRLREMLGALSLSQLKERTWTIHDEGKPLHVYPAHMLVLRLLTQLHSNVRGQVSSQASVH